MNSCHKRNDNWSAVWLIDSLLYCFWNAFFSSCTPNKRMLSFLVYCSKLFVLVNAKHAVPFATLTCSLSFAFSFFNFFLRYLMFVVCFCLPRSIQLKVHFNYLSGQSELDKWLVVKG